jgi:hypothetical protein
MTTPEEVEARRRKAVAEYERRIAEAVESAPPIPDVVMIRLREIVWHSRRPR